ncbi:C6 zinc finger protein [Phlyctema vagabunda]|uniref:C6 zinc finger protein n=1 Tax=Phlyctema vagabunda TaxID=108571 RepID=A0ABR4P3L7_9HELO
MPRPKKPGAPEPKKRSRNGCWPCKTRKVKCDEARPECVNCQKQGEPCDYSIRLNWEGRGKKKNEGTAGTGQIDFSAGMISVGSSRLEAVVSSKPSLSRNNSHQTSHTSTNLSPPTTSSFEPQISISSRNAPEENTPLSASTTGTREPDTADISMIDPALISEHMPTYQDSIFTGIQPRADHQYAQSYERYHSRSSDTPGLGQSSAIARLRDNHTSEETHTSPSDTGYRSPSIGTFSNRSLALPSIDSPASTSSYYSGAGDDLDPSERGSVDRPAKRIRQEQVHSSSHRPNMPPPKSTSFTSHNIDGHSSYSYGPAQISVSTPVTVASGNSEDGYKIYQPRSSSQASQGSPDIRRLSVSSLLSGPPGIPTRAERTYESSNNSETHSQAWPPINMHDEYTTWGIDRGYKDLDIGRNDDTNAISGTSPTSTRDHLDLILDPGELQPVEFGFGSETAFESGGYYDKPVSISIPRILEPLPAKLLENPMNLLYFHHFLNHTAGCLIPHNCSSNPFKSILPQMAVRDDNLLNLLLAYSASHRAKLLRQPEPATRIALWVQDIFPNLRHALDDPNKIISNANLATAVMLASLEIISPKAFGVAVPWQNHLDTARQMIAARGGPQTMQTASRSDKVSSFLWSWFAYLDVLGSLSGVRTNSSSSAWILDYEIDEDNDYQIDCILGFTSRCVRILAKIAELGRICDVQRIGPDLTILPDWHPSDDIVSRAESLQVDLDESRLHPAKPCTHMQSKDEAAYQWDSLEMAATNEAFHWAGMVHLHRRVFGKPSTHEDVQLGVREIFGALYKIRKGSSAEACLLFPMFTAGCDVQDNDKRSHVLERIKSVERVGMTQVNLARTLMERVWETGKPWETLVAGEFFG